MPTRVRSQEHGEGNREISDTSPAQNDTPPISSLTSNYSWGGSRVESWTRGDRRWTTNGAETTPAAPASTTIAAPRITTVSDCLRGSWEGTGTDDDDGNDGSTGMTQGRGETKRGRRTRADDDNLAPAPTQDDNAHGTRPLRHEQLLVGGRLVRTSQRQRGGNDAEKQCDEAT